MPPAGWRWSTPSCPPMWQRWNPSSALGSATAELPKSRILSKLNSRTVIIPTSRPSRWNWTSSKASLTTTTSSCGFLIVNQKTLCWAATCCSALPPPTPPTRLAWAWSGRWTWRREPAGRTPSLSSPSRTPRSSRSRRRAWRSRCLRCRRRVRTRRPSPPPHPPPPHSQPSGRQRTQPKVFNFLFHNPTPLWHSLWYLDSGKRWFKQLKQHCATNCRTSRRDGGRNYY